MCSSDADRVDAADDDDDSVSSMAADDLAAAAAAAAGFVSKADEARRERNGENSEKEW